MFSRSFKKYFDHSLNAYFYEYVMDGLLYNPNGLASFVPIRNKLLNEFTKYAFGNNGYFLYEKDTFLYIIKNSYKG